MNAEQQVRDDARAFFGYGGWILGIVLWITFDLRIHLGDLGWMFTRQLVAIAVFTAAALALTSYRQVLQRFASSMGETLFAKPSSQTLPALERASRIFESAGIAIYAAVAVALTFLDHRLLIVLLALAQSTAWIALLGLRGRARIPIAAACIGGWVLAAGVTYTHLTDFLLAAGPSESLSIVAFLASLLFCTYELAQPRAQQRSFSRVAFASAVAVFALLALRTDHFLADWVPYHRSYFSDVSDFVRQGHWLLYDVPSLYGFLSILTLGLVPAHDGAHALYGITALFLTLEATAVFAVVAWNRRTTGGYVFAALFAIATVLSDQISRYAWSPRLYPQGGMRFEWMALLLFVCFLSYVWRAHAIRRRALLIAGTAVWLISVFWALETGVWASVLWASYLVVDAMGSQSSFKRRIFDAVARLFSLAALAAGTIVVIAAYYKLRLGVFPDVRAFFEFTAFFTSGQVRQVFWVQPYGAGWVLLLVLACCGAIAFAALRTRDHAAFRLAGAAWLGLWTVSSYFAVEPLDEYIGLLMPVIALTVAIAIFLSRELTGSTAALCARVSLAPLAVIVLSVFFGEPSRLAAMRWDPSLQAGVPTIKGELETLLARAGVRPGDRVVFPSGESWTELQQGLILPYARDEHGSLVTYRSWLPMSPVGPWNLYDALTPARRKIYVERFLTRAQQGGWLVTYRAPADCEALSPHLATAKRLDSRNFSIALCTYGIDQTDQGKGAQPHKSRGT